MPVLGDGKLREPLCLRDHCDIYLVAKPDLAIKDSEAVSDHQPTKQPMRVLTAGIASLRGRAGSSPRMGSKQRQDTENP